jgi:hypothetical protein
MRTADSEIFDLALTQAIERYLDMEPNAVYDAIAEEWPEQIAVLLVEFFFKLTCGKCGDPNDFIEIERESGGGNYVAAICGCEIAQLAAMPEEPQGR